MTSTNNIQNTNNDPDIIINGLTINQTPISNNGNYLISTAANTASFSTGFGTLKSNSTNIDITSNDPTPYTALVTTSNTNAQWIPININQFYYVKVATVNIISDLTTITPGSSIDGITLSANDRVLVKDSTNPIYNGVYYVHPTGLIRTSDLPNGTIITGIAVFVNQGTIYNNTSFYIINGTVNTDQLKFQQLTNKIISSSFNNTIISSLKHIILINNTYNISSPFTITNNITIEGSGNTIITGSTLTLQGNCTFKNISFQNNLTIDNSNTINFYNTSFNNSTITTSNSSTLNYFNCKITDSFNTLSTSSYINATNTRFTETSGNVTSGTFISNTSNVVNKINNCFIICYNGIRFSNITNGTILINNSHISSVGITDIFTGTAILKINNCYIYSNTLNTFVSNCHINNSILQILQGIYFNGTNFMISNNKFINPAIINLYSSSTNIQLINNICIRDSVRQLLTINNSNIDTIQTLTLKDNNFIRTENSTINGVLITFTNGSTNVIGTGTNFTNDFISNDQFIISSTSYTISSINSTTSITLSNPWPNANISYDPADIGYQRQINTYENVINFINVNTDSRFVLPALSLQPGHKILCIRNSSSTQDFTIISSYNSTNTRDGGTWTSALFDTNDGWAIFEWLGLSNGVLYGWTLSNYNNIIV